MSWFMVTSLISICFFALSFELHHAAQFTCFKSTFLLISKSPPERVEVTKNWLAFFCSFSFFPPHLLHTVAHHLDNKASVRLGPQADVWFITGSGGKLEKIQIMLQERMDIKWLPEADLHVSTEFIFHSVYLCPTKIYLSRIIGIPHEKWAKINI